MHDLVIYLEKKDAAERFASVMSTMSEYPGMSLVKKGLMMSADKKTAIVYGDGHCLRLQEPHEYDSKYKNRYLRENLPIDIGTAPPVYVPIEKKAARLQIIGSALKKARTIVNAADNDDQGQHIADIIFEHFGIDAQNDVYRILPSALNTNEIRRLLGSLTSKKNSSMYRRGLRARTKAYVDWYFGMNASRLLTTEVKLQGLSMHLNMGTVKTPTLRIAQILWDAYKNFKPTDYFGAKGLFENPRDLSAPKFELSLAIPETLNDPVTGYPTDKGKVIEWVQSQLQGKKTGTVSHFKDSKNKVSPPKPFDTTEVYRVAEKKFKYSPKATGDSLQRLYDKGFTTYPRTEVNTLPGSGLENYQQACRNLLEIDEFSDFSDIVNPSKPPVSMSQDSGSTSEDSEAHVAIIPTEEKFIPSMFSEQDINIYMLVAERFLLQFGAPCYKAVREAKIKVGNAVFSGSSSNIVERGWKDIRLAKGQPLEDNDKDSDGIGIPELKQGEDVNLSKAQLSAKKTKRPEKTTVSDLVLRMKQAHKFIEKDNPDLAKALENAEGFGTSATREGIVTQLLNDTKGAPQLGVEKNVGHVIPTAVGRNILKYAPAEWATLEFAARLEVLYDQVKVGKAEPMQMFDKIKSEMIIPLIKPYQDNPPKFERPADEKLFPCPCCKAREGMLKKRRKDKTPFWFCIKCNTYRDDMKGAPLPIQEKEGETCDKCSKGKMRAKIITLTKDKSKAIVVSCDQYKAGCKNSNFHNLP